MINENDQTGREIRPRTTRPRMKKHLYGNERKHTRNIHKLKRKLKMERHRGKILRKKLENARNTYTYSNTGGFLSG